MLNCLKYVTFLKQESRNAHISAKLGLLLRTDEIRSKHSRRNACDADNDMVRECLEGLEAALIQTHYNDPTTDSI